MNSKLYCVFLVLLLCFIVTFQGQELEAVYVVPESSPNRSFDGEPCITLSEFAANNLKSVEQLLLVFMPGYHTLDSDIYIVNVSRLSLILSDDYSSSEMASITCQHNTRFYFEHIGSVVIGNLTFLGCGNNKVLSCDRLTVEGSTFIGHNESGTALEIIKTSACIINKCSFVSNTVGNYRGLFKDPFNSSVFGFAYIGGALITYQSHAIIANALFEGNRAELGGAIFVIASNVTIINSVFANNSADKLRTSVFPHAHGGVLFCVKSSISLIKSELYGNNATYGGVIFINNDIFKDSVSKFYDAVADVEGATVVYNQSNFSIHNSEFLNNSTHTGIKLHNGDNKQYLSAVNINGSLFHSNKAFVGGVISLIDPPSLMTIFCQSEFVNNYGTFGGVISIASKGSNVTFMKSLFDQNIGGTQGGVLDSHAQSTVIFTECIFSNNRADIFSGGVMCVSDMKSLIINGSVFINNSATNYVGGAIRLQGANLVFENSSLIANSASYGGAIYLSERSSVDFHSLCSLANNTADHGGALFAFDSTLQVYGYLEIASNNASTLGGGAMLSHCEMFCQNNGTLMISRNTALKDGGGIYASNSYIVVLLDRESIQPHSVVSFTKNMAGRWGGGIHLLMASSLLIEKKGEFKKSQTLPKNIVYFYSNSADYGGAIYVADETNYGLCSTIKYISDCFIQILSPADTKNGIYNNIVSIEFEQNRAVTSGSILFGGLLDRCTQKRDSEILKQMGYDNAKPILFVIPQVNGFTYFQNISNVGHDENSNSQWNISSLPVRVCFCQPGKNKPNCSFKPEILRIKKGEVFNVSLVAVDQTNHTLRDTIIYSSLTYAKSGLGDGQVIQTAKNFCTSFNFSIHSPHANETLIFYPEGPCRNASKSINTMKIEFSNCTCPIGFQKKVSEKNNCVCECDLRLLQSCITGCNATDQTLLRKKNCWIAFFNDSVDSHFDHGGVYLTSSSCQPGCCNLDRRINLNTVNGSDVQCMHHHTGRLCGSCKPGFSLSLGSSHCVPCSKIWPVKCVLILFIAFIFGIAFVATIMILNLTVAIGTLNGLVFYANIIDSSKSIFFIPSCFAYSMLISWFNLDIGFDLCFYEGLDTYWKTWLQLVFPIYIITLVVVIIILSRYSIKFSMLIAKKNPVATLTTLILFSYTKLLRTAIVILLKAKLQHSDHTHEFTVWLLDPTIEYGTGKHIPLFAAAILIIIVGLIFIFLLLIWQWLLKCVKYPTLCHFFDPYHAPYRFKHRYWTGLLLLARVVIYIVIIVFSHGDPNTNLLAIISTVSVLLFLKGRAVRRLYKDWKTDIIETICYLNIVLFSAVKIVILNTSDQRRYHNIATNISGLILFLLLVYVLIYQFWSEICQHCWTKLKHKLRSKIRNDGDDSLRRVHVTTDDDLGIEDLIQQNQTEPTSSVIEGYPTSISGKSYQNNKTTNAFAANIDVSDNDDDGASCVSADSATPLLRGEI